MSTYKIHRWDVVISGDSNAQRPMIYVEPDLAFLEFIRANDFAVVCNISGTGTIYDGKQIPGVVSQSSDVPSCRPNFYKKTGLYVVKLWAEWYHYPDIDKLGEVVFSGLKGVEQHDDQAAGKPDVAESSSTETDVIRQHFLDKGDYKHVGPDKVTHVGSSPSPPPPPGSSKGLSPVEIGAIALFALCAAILVGIGLYLLIRH